MKSKIFTFKATNLIMKINKNTKLKQKSWNQPYISTFLKILWLSHKTLTTVIIIKIVFHWHFFVLLIKMQIKNSFILESSKRGWGKTTYMMPETFFKDDIQYTPSNLHRLGTKVVWICISLQISGHCFVYTFKTTIWICYFVTYYKEYMK